MAEEKLVPELRFPEFEGKWVEKRLGDISKIERGRFSPRPRNNPIYYGGDVPFVQTGDVVNSRGRIKKYSQTLNEKGLEVSKLFPKGTILITIAANIGYAGILDEDMACPDSLIGISCNNGIQNHFLNLILEIEQPRMDYLAVAAAQKNINIEFLKPYKVTLPHTLPEQQKIAAFLTAVDERIRLLQRKKAKLEEYKKGVMQRLFAAPPLSASGFSGLEDEQDQNGSEDHPPIQSFGKSSSRQLRFQDENGHDFPDWEEKKLGEVAVVNMGQSPQSKSYNSVGDGTYLIQGNADIFNRFSKPRQWTNEPTKICEIGDLLLTVRAPVGSIAKSIHKACIGRGICALKAKSNSDIEYLYQYLLFFEPKWTSIEQGSTFTAISGIDIRTLKIVFPTLPEQQKIASFLSSIDTAIEKVSQQIEGAGAFKRGLLQKMFV